MSKTVEFYLSKGFDQKSAEYFASGRKKVVDVQPNSDFTLTLTFDNGEVRLYDVKPLLQKGTVFESLLNFDNFKRVYIDDCHCVAWDKDPSIDSGVVWSNKVDLCSDECYLDSVPVNEK